MRVTVLEPKPVLISVLEFGDIFITDSDTYSEYHFILVKIDPDMLDGNCTEYKKFALNLNTNEIVSFSSLSYVSIFKDALKIQGNK